MPFKELQVTTYCTTENKLTELDKKVIGAMLSYRANENTQDTYLITPTNKKNSLRFIDLTTKRILKLIEIALSAL